MQSAILQFGNRSFHAIPAPLHSRSRDEFLGVGRQMLQERIAPYRIEFPENIVDQEQRRCAFFHHEDSRLRDLQRERDRALLTIGRVWVCRMRLHKNLNVVAMWTDNCLAEPRLVRAGIRHVTREIVTISRRELELQSFAGPADLAMRGGCEW